MPMMKASRQRTAGDDSEDESGDESEDDEEESEDEEQSLIARGGVGIPIGEVSFLSSFRQETGNMGADSGLV